MIVSRLRQNLIESNSGVRLQLFPTQNKTTKTRIPRHQLTNCNYHNNYEILKKKKKMLKDRNKMKKKNYTRCMHSSSSIYTTFIH